MSEEARTCPTCGATVSIHQRHNCNEYGSITTPAFVRLPDGEPNRWAAFTDDELNAMRGPLGLLVWEMHITDEIEAEIARREAADGS